MNVADIIRNALLMILYFYARVIDTGGIKLLKSLFFCIYILYAYYQIITRITQASIYRFITFILLLSNVKIGQYVSIILYMIHCYFL